MVRTEALPPSLPLLLPSALPSVRAIAQVDQKYLVCVCGGYASEPLSLLCLDQHAIDERVRLETLTTTYVRACQTQENHNVPLPAPVPYAHSAAPRGAGAYGILGLEPLH